ncbi:MAG: 3-oxoacyl-ACP reductase FabG [Gammaproteobacteria bacterium]|nr:MAG: 3-oxoacyl-ACP reductase FabG [Gammaproteobacteria bacterium]
MSEQRLAGRVALVTGAARGLGRATALQLAREGAIVVVNDLRRELALAAVQEIGAADGRAWSHIADVSDEDQVEAMVAAVTERSGTIDILVNNAGLMRSTRPVESISLDEWQRLLAVNVTGVFLCMRAVLPILKKKRSGRIVNVSSSAGRSMSTFNGAHYTACKAAVLGLTRHVANEAAPYGINVNAIAPGSFATEGGLELFGGMPQEVLAGIIEAEQKKIPLRRFGSPQDVANAVAFLCSDESAYITGATIDINGGDLMM